jgi:cbb3-type cytochrome oxidase subunit 3
MFDQPLGGFLALAAMVAAIVVYRVIWSAYREKERQAKDRSN